MTLSGSLASSPRAVELSKPENPKTTSTTPASAPLGVAPSSVSCDRSIANPVVAQTLAPRTSTKSRDTPSKVSMVLAESWMSRKPM